MKFDERLLTAFITSGNIRANRISNSQVESKVGTKELTVGWFNDNLLAAARLLWALESISVQRFIPTVRIHS